MREIKKIVLHCSDTREGQEISAATIRGWHVNERGWSDIGYHYVVGINGELEAGRPNRKQGAHASGHNKNSIGVCYVGGKDKDFVHIKDTRTSEQKETLVKLLGYLHLMYPEAVLQGHNELSGKACPSFDVQEEYKELIEEWKNDQNK